MQLSEYPCVLIKSLECLENTKLHTCELVGIVAVEESSLRFQNLIVLSLLPPPDIRIPKLRGDHARARTAALCSA